MQTLMLKNDALKKEIEELERKLKAYAAKPENIKDAKKKTGVFGTLLKNKGLAILATAETKDKRSPKQLEAINELHELLLANKFEKADDFIKTNNKVLVGKVKKGEIPRILDFTDEYGETVLLKSVKQRKTDVTTKLLETGASIDVTDNEGETALMTAAKYGFVDMVEMLAKNANRDAKTKFTQKTALHFASQYGHLEIVKILLDIGCDPSIEDVDGKTAVKLAKNKDIYKAINKVLRKHKDQIEDMDDDDDGDNEEMEMLTGKDEYDPFKMIKKERSYSQDEQMKPLLEENKMLEEKRQNLMLQVEDMKNKRGPRDNFDVLKSLDQAGRRKFLGFDDTPTNQLVERLHALVLKGNEPGAIEQVEKMLIEKNKKKQVDRDGIDEFGETALMKASRLGYDEMVDLLLLYKCKVDMKDNDGYTALMKAAQFGKYECVQKLMNEGADLNSCTRLGKLTALMLAAQRGHGKICELLIAEGANHGAVDSTGQRAVDHAKNPEAKQVIENAMNEHPINEGTVQI